MALNWCTAEIELLKLNKDNYQFNRRFQTQFLQYPQKYREVWLTPPPPPPPPKKKKKKKKKKIVNFESDPQKILPMANPEKKVKFKTYPTPLPTKKS